MQRLLQQLMRGEEEKDDDRRPDSSETVYISSLALLKMLRHARSGVPLEVMGLLLGHFIDHNTLHVVDVFAMPQSGTSIDPVYQTKMLDMLATVGRHEKAVGWYHSHPGFGCWLSNVDVKTQKTFESLHPRAVAIVVDPVQSVKGKVMIEAFRSTNSLETLSNEVRDITSNLGHLMKPNATALMRGLTNKYYALNVDFKMDGMEQWMLTRVHEHTWIEGIQLHDFDKYNKQNCVGVEDMLRFTKTFEKVGEGKGMKVQELTMEPNKKEKVGKKNKQKEEISTYGKMNVKQRLEEHVMKENIMQLVSSAINRRIFH